MDFPISLVVRADRTVLLATVVISVLTGVIFGILPALRASGVAPVTVLKEESGSASGGLRKARLASVLVVAQISLSLVLLVCTGLFIRSFLRAQKINLGFNPKNVLIASYDLFTAGYSEAKGTEFDRELVAKLEALPGMQAVSLTDRLPGLSPGSTSVRPEGYVSHPNESMETSMAIVTPKFFQTMEIPLAKGRDFTPQDNRNSQRATIVSEAFANRYWPAQEALGKRVNSDLTHEWFTVVGVARDSKMTSLSGSPAPFLYLAFYQVYRGTMRRLRYNGRADLRDRAALGLEHRRDPAFVLRDLCCADCRTRIQRLFCRWPSAPLDCFQKHRRKKKMGGAEAPPISLTKICSRT
jgi:hypothetical protein